jgi:hypothetical protein
MNGNGCACDPFDDICAAFVSRVNSIDTVKIIGSGLLSVGITGGSVNNVDILQVLNPLGPIVSQSLVLSVVSASDLNVYNAVNYINGSLTINDTGSTGPIILANIFPYLIGINGDLIITISNITKISGFYKLKYITGMLKITNNGTPSSLTTIPAFADLLLIDCGQPYVIPLPNPITLPNITSANSIMIINNDSLSTINSFEKLKYVGSIIITSNTLLQSICAFNCLESVNFIEITFNSVVTLTGFNHLQYISDHLLIDSNNPGTNVFVCNAFCNLIFVGNLVITNNHNLKSLVFNSLISSQDILIGNNDLLMKLSMDHLHTTNSIYLVLNPSLISFNLNELTRINGQLNVVQNEVLHSICTEKLSYVANSIQIISNANLIRLDDFIHLRIIGSESSIATSYSLNNSTIINTSWDVAGFIGSSGLLPNVVIPSMGSPIVIANSIVILQNPILRKIHSFNALTQACSMYIISNHELKTINAFNSMMFALDLIMIDDHSLKTIKIFNSLCSIRYMILRDTMCADKICGLKRLCQADLIYLDILSLDAIPNFTLPLPTVEAVYSYYAFVSN